MKFHSARKERSCSRARTDYPNHALGDRMSQNDEAPKIEDKEKFSTSKARIEGNRRNAL